MPLYDRRCESCGTERYDLMEPVEAPPVLCLDCGEPTVRAWLGKGASVVGDEMDHVQINGLKEPRRFTSKQEHSRWLKANGFRINDAHVGAQGSDKNKFTTRSVTMDPVTLANATELVNRTASIPAKGAGGEELGLTSNAGVVHYLRNRSRIERGEFF